MALLDGKVAIVTGAGRGIGREEALLLAKQGAKVVVNDLGGHFDGTGQSRSPAEEVIKEIRGFGGEAVANFESVSDFKSSKRIVEYAEITWFGDTRYSEDGIAMRQLLNRAADLTFRSRLKMPVDVYEGPAMNHSFHEMIIGHGKCFSIVLAARKQAQFSVAGYQPDYHMAQFLATKQALEKRGRHVLAFLVDDLEDLAKWFETVASNL